MNSMELKFLIDVGVGKGIENYLHTEGYDIKAVRDIDPCLEDKKIIRRYHRGWENFNKQYKYLVDDWIVFDNSGDIPLIMEKKI